MIDINQKKHAANRPQMTGGKVSIKAQKKEKDSIQSKSTLKSLKTMKQSKKRKAQSNRPQIFSGKNRLDVSPIQYLPQKFIQKSCEKLKLSPNLSQAIKESVIVFKQQKLAGMAISIHCLDKFLGEGTYSWVYSLKKGSYVVKIGKCEDQSINREYAILSSLSKLDSLRFPQVFGTGALEVKDGEASSPSHKNYLLMERLGVSVEQLINLRGQLTLTTITQIGRQILHQLSLLIAQGVSHHDVKPTNILFGIGQKRKQVFLIDYGLASDSSSKGNLTFSASQKLRGSSRHFLSNDLQSLIYVLIWTLKDGKLPWQLGQGNQSSFHRRADQILSLRKEFMLEILSLKTDVTDRRGTLLRELVDILWILESNQGMGQKELLSKLEALLS